MDESMREADRETAVVASAAAVAFLVAVLAHRWTVTYWFTASDTVPMIQSSRVTGVGDLFGHFTEPMMAGTRFVDFLLFYRPLSSLSFAIDYWLWGLDPAGYHLTSILLHGLAAAVATIALVTLTRRRIAGLLGGLLFAGHPLTAEVVPSTVRRHDVLMTIFVLSALVLFVRSRREVNRRPTLVGSLTCYVLALLSKEPALVFPGLVVGWVALGRDRPWSREGLTAAMRALAPFLVVTVAYLAVRLSVLGSLGGYIHQSLSSPAEVVLILVEYPLSLWYPHDVVGMGTLPGAGFEWQLFLAMLTVVGVTVLGAAGVTMWLRWFGGSEGATIATADATIADSTATADDVTTAEIVATAGAVTTAAALVAVPLAIAFEASLVRTVPILYDPDQLTAVQLYLRPSAAIVGLLLVAAVVSVVAWAAADTSSSLRSTDRRSLAFFGIWLLGAVIVFLPSGFYAFRSGYASLVPAMGAVGLVLAVGLDGLRSVVDRTAGSSPWDRVSAADVGLAGVALMLVIPLVATTPVVHHYDGWEVSGRANEATLTGVQAATDGAPPEATVEINGMLGVLGNRGCSFPRAKNLQFTGSGTVESWLRLHGEDRPVTARDPRVLAGPPQRVTVTSERTDGTVNVTVHYEGIEQGSCVETPWERY